MVSSQAGLRVCHCTLVSCDCPITLTRANTWVLRSLPRSP
jgi:hypothetical protein